MRWYYIKTITIILLFLCYNFEFSFFHKIAIVKNNYLNLDLFIFFFSQINILFVLQFFLKKKCVFLKKYFYSLLLTNCNSIIRYIFILIFIFDLYEILRDNETHRIFESRIPIAPFRRPRHSFASNAVVRGNTVKAVSVQRHWSTSFAVVKSRLPFPHNELQIIFQFLHRRSSLSLSLFSQ